MGPGGLQRGLVLLGVKLVTVTGWKSPEYVVRHLRHNTGVDQKPWGGLTVRTNNSSQKVQGSVVVQEIGPGPKNTFQKSRIEFGTTSTCLVSVELDW